MTQNDSYLSRFKSDFTAIFESGAFTDRHPDFVRLEFSSSMELGLRLECDG
ncbi:MAG: hypothetical protein H7A33_05965 [Deltaproteobacteria bacterium]|nr:hypothetical protein [Deltaproteobacteria bacterium]